MTEREYILVGEAARIRAAVSILRDVTPTNIASVTGRDVAFVEKVWRGVFRALYVEEMALTDKIRVRTSVRADEKEDIKG